MPAILDEKQQFVDAAGRPLVNGFVYFGVQNADPVLNPVSIFSDRALTIALSNPQTLDSLGQSTNKVWIDGPYSMKVEDLNNVQIDQELDNGEEVSSGITSISNIVGSDTITGTASTTITAYVDKELYTFISAAVNTGAVTLNFDSVGGKSFLKNHNQAFVAGDIEAHQAVIAMYNATDDTFEWVNQNLGYIEASIAAVIAGLSVGINFIGGLTTSNGTDADHDIDIAVGEARDDGNTANITLASAITKQIDAAWAVGDDAGGLDGTESSGGTPDSSTVYYVWLIKRTDTGVVDALFSESATAPILPTNYDLKRLIGFVVTNASANVRSFNHRGNSFRFTSALVDDVLDASVTTSFETGTLGAPADCVAYMHMNANPVNMTTGVAKTWTAWVRPVEGTSELSSNFEDGAVGALNAVDGDDTSGINDFVVDTQILLDSSSQFEYAGIQLASLGFRVFSVDMLTRTDP